MKTWNATTVVFEPDARQLDGISDLYEIQALDVDLEIGDYHIFINPLFHVFEMKVKLSWIRVTLAKVVDGVKSGKNNSYFGSYEDGWEIPTSANLSTGEKESRSCCLTCEDLGKILVDVEAKKIDPWRTFFSVSIS
ncbi:MAG: hypothetical protein NT141_04235 [candidate division WWE3 bacterium]|nr:hypothetical protein [candidate division WWE3 bacterium]